MLKETDLEIDFPLDELARGTDGLSGSDLKELCRNAAIVPVREYMKKLEGDSTAMADLKSQVLPRHNFLLGSHPDHSQRTSDSDHYPWKTSSKTKRQASFYSAIAPTQRIKQRTTIPIHPKRDCQSVVPLGLPGPMTLQIEVIARL